MNTIRIRLPEEGIGSKKFGGPKLQALSVLVVDDNKFMRPVVKNLCKGLGVGAFAKAEDLEQALTILREWPIDLVVTDWYTQSTDGLTLVKYLRNPHSICDDHHAHRSR